VPSPLRPYPRRTSRPDIPLPSGKTLTPRIKFAESIGLSDDTVRKMNLPTTYIGSVAYVPRDASLREIASRTKRRNEPPARRRRPK
jgi:hypothetical protein